MEQGVDCEKWFIIRKWSQEETGWKGTYGREAEELKLEGEVTEQAFKAGIPGFDKVAGFRHDSSIMEVEGGVHLSSTNLAS